MVTRTHKRALHRHAQPKHALHRHAQPKHALPKHALHRRTRKQRGGVGAIIKGYTELTSKDETWPSEVYVHMKKTDNVYLPFNCIKSSVLSYTNNCNNEYSINEDKIDQSNLIQLTGKLKDSFLLKLTDNLKDFFIKKKNELEKKNNINHFIFYTLNDFMTLTGHSSAVWSVAFSADGKYVVSGSRDESVKLWSTETGKVVRTLTGHSDKVTSVAFSPDGKYVVSGSDDKSVKLWSIMTGEVGQRFLNLFHRRLVRTLTGHSMRVNSVAFSADGKYVVSGSRDWSVKLWSTETDKVVRTLTGHSGAVNSVAFSADGKHVVSGSDDKSVKLWSTKTGDVVRTLTGHSNNVTSVAFSADGMYVVSGSDDKSVKLWSTDTGKVVHTLTGHSDYVNSVAFSPNGKYVVSGSHDTSVKLWSTDTGKVVRTLTGHSSAVTSVAFSTDGLHVVSGSYDNNVKLWTNLSIDTTKTPIVISAPQPDEESKKYTVFTDFDNTLTEKHVMFKNSNIAVDADKNWTEIDKTFNAIKEFENTNIVVVTSSNTTDVTTAIQNIEPYNKYFTVNDNTNKVSVLSAETFNNFLTDTDFTTYFNRENDKKKEEESCYRFAFLKYTQIKEYLENKQNYAAVKRSLFIDDSIVNCNLINEKFPEMLVIWAENIIKDRPKKGNYLKNLEAMKLAIEYIKNNKDNEKIEMTDTSDENDDKLWTSKRIIEFIEEKNKEVRVEDVMDAEEGEKDTVDTGGVVGEDAGVDTVLPVEDAVGDNEAGVLPVDTEVKTNAQVQVDDVLPAAVPAVAENAVLPPKKKKWETTEQTSDNEWVNKMNRYNDANPLYEEYKNNYDKNLNYEWIKEPGGRYMRRIKQKGGRRLQSNNIKKRLTRKAHRSKAHRSKAHRSKAHRSKAHRSKAHRSNAHRSKAIAKNKSTRKKQRHIRSRQTRKM